MRLKQLIFGLATFLPGFYERFGYATGGTDSARYCYSVWLRHVARAHRAGVWNQPKVVAELGPGDSLGIGLAALLTGADSYLAFDVVEHATNAQNLRIFDELVDLVRARTDIPGDDEFPDVKPRLEAYEFPSAAISDAAIDRALAPPRLARLRAAITDKDGPETPIRYVVPWHASDASEDAMADMIFSQAVMEHVDEIEGAYAAMRLRLKSSGFMSHQIDFRCHRTADEWNGHWAYSDLHWFLLRGRRPYLINRQPYSTHLDLLKRNDFELIVTDKFRQNSGLPRHELARRFRGMSSSDFETSGVYVVARPAA